MTTPPLLRRSLGVACATAAILTTPYFLSSAHADYHPTGKEQEAISKLIADLREIKAGSHVTTAEKQAIAADFELLATSTTKPSQASITQLTDDLTAALADGSISAAEKAELTVDLDAIFNSAGLTIEEAQKFIADAEAILKASGVNAADAKLIASDLAAIASDLQLNFIVTTSGFPLEVPSSDAKAFGHVRVSSALRNDDESTASIAVSTIGLVTGTYTVSATTSASGTPVTLGHLKVKGRADKPGTGAAIFGHASTTALPAGFKVADLTKIIVANASGVTELTGTESSETKTRTIGNFRIEPGAVDPSAFGDVAFSSLVKGSKNKTRFLLVAAKLPESAALTLKVNGVVAGTLETDAKGRLVITEGAVSAPGTSDEVIPATKAVKLPADVDVSTLKFLEFLDASGAVVATAGFAS